VNNPTRAYLGLGSNIDAEANLPAALTLLEEIPGIVLRGVSPLYRTPPWGNTDQPPFLNAVLAIDTDLEPLALLDAVQGVENSLHRKRTRHWGPRTMDIDLLLFGEEIVREPRLTLPHPYLHLRGFVLIPLCDLAPEIVHPERGRTMAELLEDLPHRQQEGIEAVELPGMQP